MPTYMIERNIPGASKLSEAELIDITTTSNDAVDRLELPYKWLHSYVAGDKIYCVHEADNEQIVRDHARIGGFPADLVEEVVAVFDSTGPRVLPV
jgi:hypothetical protein